MLTHRFITKLFDILHKNGFSKSTLTSFRISARVPVPSQKSVQSKREVVDIMNNIVTSKK